MIASGKRVVYDAKFHHGMFPFNFSSKLQTHCNCSSAATFFSTFLLELFDVATLPTIATRLLPHWLAQEPPPRMHVRMHPIFACMLHLMLHTTSCMPRRMRREHATRTY